MAFSLIGTRGKQSADTVTTGNTTAIDTTTADLIVVVRSFYQAVGTPNLSDSAGCTWTNLMAYSSTNTRVIISYCSQFSGLVTSASHTFVATTAATATYPSISVIVLSGAKTSADPFDSGKDAGANTSGATSLAPGSLTPSEDNCLLVTGIAAGNGSGAPGGVTGYTIDQSFDFVTTGGGRSGGIAHLIQTTAGASNPSWTFSSDEAAAALAVFKAATGGGATGHPTMRRWGGVPGMSGNNIGRGW